MSNSQPHANQTEQAPTKSANHPQEVLRDGALKATIWRNEGEKGTFFSTVLAKTYEDRNGKVRDTTQFSGNELLRVAELARDAYAVSNDLRRDAQQTPTQNHPQGEPAQNPEAQKEAFKESRRAGRSHSLSKKR